MAPRWVWNCRPASRTTVCSRPLGSVSCTRSPARKAPGTGSASSGAPAEPTCPSTTTGSSGTAASASAEVGASSVGCSCCPLTCCPLTCQEGTDDGSPVLRRAHSELSEGPPNLVAMTVTVETDRSAGAPQTGNPATGTPATGRTTAEDTTPRRPSLSPSRAADFKSCPLLYRFRTIDRLPERKTRAAVRGTLVHAVLEKLYDL